MTQTSNQIAVKDQVPQRAMEKAKQLIGTAADAQVQIEAASDYEIRPRTFRSISSLAGEVVLWDIANQQRHQADKEIQQQSGPSLVLSFSYNNFRAAVQHAYIDRADGFGVKSPRTADPIAFPVPDNRPETIYASLLSNRGRRHFELRGIKIDALAILQLLDDVQRIVRRKPLALLDAKKFAILGELRKKFSARTEIPG